MKSEKMNFTENHLVSIFMVSIETHFVGVAGFEPATSCSQSRRDNRATLHPEKRDLSVFGNK
jgi:hypothetical protein